jgi:hypothetical protein
MTPFQAYQLYTGLHAHFSGKYDYFKYNGKMKSATRESFEKRNEKYLYTKLASHRDPQGLIVATHVLGQVKWVGDLFEDRAETAYSNYVKYHNNVTYNYKNELKKVLGSVDGDLDELLKPKGGSNPKIVHDLMGSFVRPETFLILNDTFLLIDYYDRHVKDFLIWPDIRMRLIKFDPFFQRKTDELKVVTKEVCLNNQPV